MRPVEHMVRDPDFFDASIPGQRRFVVAVDDATERFLPVAFEVLLPLPHRGVFLASNDVSPFESAPAGVHLFSAPTRRASERLTAVRGTLVDADGGNRAAWAVVRVAAPHGRSYYGMADDEGRFAVMFPYPSLPEGFAGSPASFGNGSPVGERGWDISIRVLHEPGRLTGLPGTSIPEYRSILSQRQGGLYDAPPSATSHAIEHLDARLAFGQELILRTAGLHVQLAEPSPTSP